MSRRQQIGVGCLMVVAAVVTAGLAVTLGGIRGLGGTTSFQAPISDAAGLARGALVSVHGVEVGQITALELTPEAAVVHFEVDDEVVLREGAMAQVRARSLLGEKYLALDLGAGAPLAEGTELAPVGEQYEVDELVAVITPLLQAIDPEALARATDVLAATLEDDPEMLARMLRDAETALDGAARASTELEPLMAESRAAIGEARGAISVLQARGREAQGVVARADAVLAKLDTASEPLPETVDEARATLAEARSLIAELRTASADVQRLLDGVGDLDRDTIREILREEGVRVRLFGSGGSSKDE